jgi:hypothetical protein
VSGLDARPSRRQLGRLALVYAASRVVVCCTVLVANWTTGTSQSPGSAFTSWDGAWYGLIVRDGYPRDIAQHGSGSTWAFFPAWPLLLRGTHFLVGGSWQRNGIAWALVLGFVTVVLLHIAVADVLGSDTAFDTVVLFSVAPAAAVLSMTYSEVLFIPACLACIVLLRRERWLSAGLVALVGGATRMSGVALVVVCLVEAVVACRRIRSWRPLIAPALAPLGLVAWFVYQRVHAGTWTASFTVERYWGNGNSWGLEVLRAFHSLFTDGSAWDYPPGVLMPLLVVLVTIAAIALRHTPGVPRSWWVLTIVLCGFAVSPTLLHSGPRYFLPAFPLFAGVAARVPRRWFPLVVGASAVLMTAISVLWFSVSSAQMPP